MDHSSHVPTLVPDGNTRESMVNVVIHGILTEMGKNAVVSQVAMLAEDPLCLAPF